MCTDVQEKVERKSTAKGGCGVGGREVVTHQRHPLVLQWNLSKMVTV